MTLLLLSGSTRASSTNGAALDAIADSPGIDATIFGGLVDLPAFNPDDDHDPLPASVQALRAAIAAADALIICTPEYAGTLPGSFKNLLDWTVGGPEIGGKPVAWISVAAPGRGAGAIAALGTVLSYVGADVIADACVHVPIARGDLDAHGRIVDPVILKRLRDAADAAVSRSPGAVGNTDFDEVIAAERALLDPAVRADSTALSALLDERFIEYGSSGAVWDRSATIALLADSPGVRGTEPSDFQCTRIAPDAILLTYRTTGERTVLRSSLWVRADGAWRVRFHQATPVQPH